MTTFFTADLHLFNKGVIAYCERPFEDVDAMTEALVERWNDVVGAKDDVWVLGDFAFHRKGLPLERTFDRLAGRKHLVVGNHDHKEVRRLPWASQPVQRAEITVDGVTFVLDHYPMVTWNKKQYGTRHLFGHVHGKIPGTAQSIDVGVDSWGYRPVGAERLVAVMDKLPKPTWDEGAPIQVYDAYEPEPGLAP